MASRKAGYSEEELLAAGLASRSRDGSGRLFDRFRGRIMFPLADERGRVLGFGARALGEGQQPKYLNTSDGEVFHKGRMVYGADLARAAAAKAGRVVLVEGYTDVIALRQAGVPEAVCSMGTALTPSRSTRWRGWRRACCSARTRTRRARRRSAAGWRALRRAQRRPPDGHQGGLPDRAAARRPGSGRRRAGRRRRRDAPAARRARSPCRTTRSSARSRAT